MSKNIISLDHYVRLAAFCGEELDDAICELSPGYRRRLWPLVRRLAQYYEVPWQQAERGLLIGCLEHGLPWLENNLLGLAGLACRKKE